MGSGVVGSGSLSAALTFGRNLTATLLGSGGITTAQLGLISGFIATLQGTGNLTASLSQVVQFAATLLGQGNVAPALGLLAYMAAIASGAGGITTDLKGKQTFDATIRSYGDLTPEGVRDSVWAATASLFNQPGTMGELLNLAGSGGVNYPALAAAVWGKAIEAGFTAEQLLRIIAAQAAGAATGLESGNPQFTGVDGTTLRIDGTYSAGTRTIDSLNGN